MFTIQQLIELAKLVDASVISTRNENHIKHSPADDSRLKKLSVLKDLELAISQRVYTLYSQPGKEHYKEIYCGQGMIAAIKAYRSNTGKGLMDSKNQIQEWAATNGWKSPYDQS